MSAFNFQGGDNCPPNRIMTAAVRAHNASRGPTKFIVSTSLPFFRAVETAPELPTFSTECMVKYWNGIYESHFPGRVENRRQENTLLATEALATAAFIEGMAYPGQQLWDGWYLTLLNQHHDPLMSPMAVTGLWEAAMPIRNEAAKTHINAALSSTISWLAADIGTTEEPGTPVIVFNPSPWERSAVAEVCVEGVRSSASVVDRQGRAMVAEVVESCCGCTTVAFQALDLPALGWRTYYVSDAPGTDTGITGVTAAENMIENEYIRIELQDGMIERIVDKASGAAVMEAGPKAGVNEILIWKDEGCISVIKPADEWGLVQFIDNPDAVLVARSSEAADRAVSVVDAGPARGAVRVAYSLDCGAFSHTISLEAGSRMINFATDIDWDSAGKLAPFDGRRVRVAFSSTYEQADVVCDIPFGVIPWEQSELIRPVNSWLEIGDADSGVALMHFGNPSVQAVDDVIYMTLFRSIVEPSWERIESYCHWDSPGDTATEDGKHTIQYALYVHPGDWKSANTARTAASANSPVYTKVAKRFTNITGPLLPGEATYLSLSPESLVVSAIKPTEYGDGGILVRACNPTDEAVSGTLEVRFDHSGVEEVDFREELVKALDGLGGYQLEFAPFEIKALRIAL
jgi:alpha-mannosidase